MARKSIGLLAIALLLCFAVFFELVLAGNPAFVSDLYAFLKRELISYKKKYHKD